MELLRKSETDILEGFSTEIQQAARQRIIRAILATDPAFHFQLADELEALKAANPELSGPATLLDERTKDACLMRAGRKKGRDEFDADKEIEARVQR